MNKGRKAVQSTSLRDATTACGLTAKTADPRTVSKRTSTKPSVLNRSKVLGALNRTVTNTNKMGLSQATTARLSTTSRRMSAGYHTTQRLKKTPTTLITRKTMDVKSFSHKPTRSGEKTDPADSSKIVFAKPNKTTDKLSCPVTSCDMTFFYKTSLAAHVKSHATQNACKHCGRNFAIPTALSKHLREHCPKISIAERKKLLESDFKLEEEKTPVKVPKPSRAKDELLDLVFTSYSPSSGLDRVKAVSFKDFAPIKGIGRTPRKLITCYECGDKFKNPLQFATHAEHCAAPKIDFKLTET